MVKVTKQEVIFLVLCPVLHCALSFVFLMMAISTGLGPGDAGDPPVTQGQEVASKIGSVLYGFALLAIYRLLKTTRGERR